MNLLELIPDMNRARGYHFYTSSGRRYLDMWLENGAAILGHRQKKFALALKDTIDRGIFSPVPSKYAYRLKQGLKEIFGEDKKIYIFHDPEAAELALKNKNISFEFWRPFGESGAESCVFIPVLPVPGGFAPGIVIAGHELPLSEETVSPVCLSGTVRAVWNLKEFLVAADYSIWQDKEFMNRTSAVWKVQGPYLYPCISEEKYNMLFRYFLENNIIISPFYDRPSVLPAEISEGEFRKIIRIISEFSNL
ncbi:MAG: hypothetical protein MJ215_00340 [Spirochaetia bacterium]|nr:hypothetical protein [Spirochaetia bacterium]